MNKLFFAVIIAILIIFYSSVAYSTSQPTDYFRSCKSSSSWEDSYTWESSPDGLTWERADLIPTTQSRGVTIKNDLIKIYSNIVIDQLEIKSTGRLKIETGSLTVNNSNSGLSDLIIYGTLWNKSNIILNCTGEVMDGGLYEHSYADATKFIPPLIWNDGSTLKISNIVSPFIGLNYYQSLYNLIFEAYYLNDDVCLNIPNGFTLRGNLELQRNSSKIFYLCNTSTPQNINVNGSLIIDEYSKNYFNQQSTVTSIYVGKDLIFNSTGRLYGSQGKSNIILINNGTIHNVPSFKCGLVRNTILQVSENARAVFSYVDLQEYNNICQIYGSMEASTLINTTPENLILYDGASLMTPSACAATVKKEVSNADWSNNLDGVHMISSPVTSQQLSSGGFIANPPDDYDFFAWSEPLNNWLNQKIPENNITEFIPGQGYFVAYNQGGVKTFAGTINSSPVSFTNLSKTGASPFAGFHLMGNPFPSGIDWSDPAWNRTNVSNVAFVWNAAAMNYEPVMQTYNSLIPSCTGFFIQALDEVNAITIPASAKALPSSSKKDAHNGRLLVIKAQSLSDVTFDRTIIALDEMACNAADQNDGRKLTGSPLAPRLYSRHEEMGCLAVNALPVKDYLPVIPLVLEKGQADAYKLVVEINNLGTNAFLEDRDNGAFIPLQEGCELTVTNAPDVKHFFIHLSPLALAEHSADEDVIVYFCDNRIFVHNLPPDPGNWEFMLYDLHGGLMVSDIFIAADNVVSVPLTHRLCPGMYVACFKNKTSFISRKVVII